MAAAIAFDVNETLLDIAALDPEFERRLGDPGARVEWFSATLRAALVSVVTGRHTPFATLADGALRAVAIRRGIELSAADRGAILGGLRELPPHPDVPGGLDAVRAAGLPVAALTNNAPDAIEEQVRAAGLADRFDMLISVEEVGRLKPAPEVYRHAASRLGVGTGELRLVAAHDWDLLGAAAAGCATAWVARPSASFTPPEEIPEIHGPDLRAVAERIVAVDRAR